MFSWTLLRYWLSPTSDSYLAFVIWRAGSDDECVLIADDPVERSSARCYELATSYKDSIWFKRSADVTVVNYEIVLLASYDQFDFVQGLMKIYLQSSRTTIAMGITSELLWTSLRSCLTLPVLFVRYCLCSYNQCV